MNSIRRRARNHAKARTALMLVRPTPVDAMVKPGLTLKAGGDLLRGVDPSSFAQEQQRTPVTLYRCNGSAGTRRSSSGGSL